MLIRRMKISDVDRVSELEEMAFSMPWHRESFIEMISNPDAIYLVALDDNIPVGVCGIRSIVGEGDISNVVTDPEYRRKGIAEKLLSEAMRIGQEEYGITAFTLEVRVSNAAAIGLYEKLGFAGEGIRPGFYEKPDEDALIMWRRIDA